MRLWMTTLAIAVLLPIETAAVADATHEPWLTVGGQATVEVEPDHALLRVGVETQRDSAAAAQKETNRVAAEILAGLERLGVPEDAVQTSSLNVRPIYSQRRQTSDSTAPEVIGYRADNTIQVTLSDLGLVGPAIDAAIEARGNRLLGLSFGLREDGEAQKQALAAAVVRANDKALVIARALGSKLGRVIEVQEGGVAVRPIATPRMRVEMAADSPAPVAAGKVTVSASVTIRYALGD